MSGGIIIHKLKIFCSMRVFEQLGENACLVFGIE